MRIIRLQFRAGETIRARPELSTEVSRAIRPPNQNSMKRKPRAMVIFLPAHGAELNRALRTQKFIR